MHKRKLNAMEGNSRASQPAQPQPDLLPAAMHNAKLVSQRALHTFKLSVALKASEGTFAGRMQAVANLLKEDAVRSDPLIDLSFTIEGDKSCVLFQLLHFFHSCSLRSDDTDHVNIDKLAAMRRISSRITSLQEKLLRSFDPVTVDAATGNNALHELVGLIRPAAPDCWSTEIIQMLIARGVSVHERNKAGCTPLVHAASIKGPTCLSAVGMRVLLSHGAHLNAQDNNGDGVLHHLAKRKALSVLTSLLSGDDVGHLDLHLVNSEGHTAVDCAAIQLAQSADEVGTQRVHRLLITHMALWRKDVRLVLELCLQPVLIPDLAAMVMDYIDGSGAPFASNAEDPPASAAAPAQH